MKEFKKDTYILHALYLSIRIYEKIIYIVIHIILEFFKYNYFQISYLKSIYEPAYHQLVQDEKL